MQRGVAPGRLDGELIGFHTDKRFDDVGQFDSEEADAAIEVDEVFCAAVHEKFTRGFDEFRQQEEIILEKGVAGHFPVFGGDA